MTVRKKPISKGNAQAIRVASMMATATLFIAASPAAQANTYYWDSNDGTAGFGTASGTWAAPTVGSPGWTTDPTGSTVIDLNSITTATTDSINFGNGATGLAAGTITVSGTESAGNMTFASGSGAIVLSGGTINLAAADTITLNNAADTISSVLSSAGTGLTTAGTGTLTLSAANTYTGATVLNNSAVISLSGSGSILTTAGITFNGGTLSLVKSGTNTNEVSDSAGITANYGTFSVTNSTSGPFSETIGSVNLALGQFNFVYSNAAGSGNVTTLSGLARSSSTSAVTFSGSALATNNQFVVTGATATAAGQIIGPWATTGTTAALQTDYAVYSSTAAVVPAGIAATAESSWTTPADAYTANAGFGAITLSATRNVAALRSISAANSVTFTANSPTIALSGSTLNAGDAVVFGGTTVPTGLTAGTIYYVVNPVSGTSFQVSATSGGAAITPTTAGTTVTATGAILLSTGNNLGTTGILNGVTNTLTIAATGTGAVTLPTTSAGDLFVTAGSGSISIAAPIQDNTGALTLVKSGSGTLTLSGPSTYSGGTVVNSGTVVITADNNLGAANTNLSITGNSRINVATALNSSLTYTHPIAISSGVVLSLQDVTGVSASSGTASTAIFSGAVTGAGGISTIGQGSSNNADVIIALSNPNNTFTGPLTLAPSGNSADDISFASIGDASGSGPITIGKTSYRGWVIYNGSTNLTLNYRQLTLASTFAGTVNGNGSPANDFQSDGTGTITFMQNLAVPATATGTFYFDGTNTGNNTFAGNIPNPASGTLSIEKFGAGKWIFSGANSYTGLTTIGAGTLSINSIQDAGSSTANALGEPPTGANSIIALLTAGTLQYTGNGNSSNRVINLVTTGGGTFTLDASGSGTLALTGGVTCSGTSGTSTLTLIGTGLGSESGAIANGTGTNVTAVTKTGIGTWTLTGTNSYTGATNITGGTLLVSGSSSGTGAVTVGGTPAATLGGSGSIAGAATISATGALAPSGGSTTPSTLTFTNTGTSALKVAGSYAPLLVSNGATLGSDLVTFSGKVTLGGVLAPNDAAYLPFAMVGDTFLIMDGAPGSGATASLPSNTFFSNAPSNGSQFTDAAGITYMVNYDMTGAIDTGGTGQDVVLTVEGVPEPGSLGLLGVAALGLLSRRRRRIARV